MPRSITDLISNKDSLTIPQLYQLVQELKAQAAAIGIGRSSIPDNPADFAAKMSKGQWESARHLELLSSYLADLESGKRHRLLVSMPPRHGKQIADSTPVLTTAGFKRHGDLRVGDEVFGISGKPVKVLAVSAPSNKKLLVTLTTGEQIKCHPNHEWTVYDRARNTYATYETSFMWNSLLWSGDRARFQLPQISPLQFEHVDLPVDPYTLGVWLGDGTTGVARICGSPKDMAHIIPKIPYEHGYTYIHPITGVYYKYFKKLSHLLRDLGVFYSKRIPKRYLLASEEQRRALLSGIVDTDGSVDRTGRVHVVTVIRELADDIALLARSLGYRVGIYQRKPITRNRVIVDKLVCYEIAWTPHDGRGQGTLPRKVNPRTFTPRRTGIKSIEPTIDEPGRCIQVEAEDGLYLVGTALTPTHNSELISVWTPIWLLARNPKRRIILASYEFEFAAHWGRRVRDWIRDYGEQLQLTLDTASTAAHRWNLSSGGGMMTAGAGGPITGKGADVLIIDDPIKGDEDASSEVMREKLWSWWQTVAMTRLEPGAFVVILGTRWHEDDLIGRLDKQSQTGEGQKWDVLKLPAIATADDPLGRSEGEPLWPDRYPLETEEREGRVFVGLNEIRRGQSPYHWSALYQQSPTPEEGNAVKRTWWKWYSALPANPDQWIQSWDLAFEDMKKSDYCVGQVWCRKGAEVFLVDQIRERMNAVEVINHIKLWKDQYPLAVAKIVENRANGPAVIQILQKEVQGMIPMKAKGSKDARLQGVIPLIEAGNVYLPRPDIKPWITDFVEEFAAFPRAPHDDQVDAAVYALLYMQPQGWLHITRKAKEAEAEKPPEINPLKAQQQAIFSSLRKAVKRSDSRFNKPHNPRRTANW